MSLDYRKLTLAAGAACAVCSGSAMASGFALIENGASGLGNAYAGGAAAALDASTIYFNPAGMTYLPERQMVVAVHAILPSAKFTDKGSANAAPRPLGTDGGDAGSLAAVPNAYFATALNAQTRLGIGVNVPFGLQTEYTSDWIGRFQAVKSKLETINVNPSIAYQVSDAVSIGAGVSYQTIDGELTAAYNMVTSEGMSKVKGDDQAWGYNLGMLIKAGPQTRIGLAYRSQINYKLSGTMTVTSATGSLLASNPVTLKLDMPDSFSASLHHQLDERWSLMADATWTGWSVLKELNVVTTSGTSVLNVQENWVDTWRVAVGTSYRYNDRWTARFGLALDQTPVKDAYRTARIPDAERIQVAIGGQYKPSDDSAIDFGYSHLFGGTVSINDLQGATAFTQQKGNLIGEYAVSVDILSVQYTKNF